VADPRPPLPAGPAPLIADRAIEHADQDRLERGGVVDAITRTIEHAPRDGFVIGLEGRWGEGKTSVLNLVAERLDLRGSAQIVRFNPWLFAGSDELLQRFFSELAAGVRLPDGKPAERLARALDAYGLAMAPLGGIPTVGPVARLTATVAKGTGRLLRAGRSLRDQRDTAKKELAAMDRPIVVLVDDLDRPHPHGEIAEMVRLIRLVGDLPRITYLVAYEREQVARALGGGDDPEQVQRGREYLEKIVQTVFEVPPARRDLLDDVLTKALDEALGPLLADVSVERWTALQLAGVRGLFRNLRDIRRYASALTATVALIGEEVELADVLALEALRVLEPMVATRIADAADLVTELERDRFGTQPALKEDARRQQLADMVASARRPDIVTELVQELFPATARYLGRGGGYGSSWLGTWRRERRVAHPDVLRIYLDRGLPADAMPLRTVREALVLLDDRPGLARLLQDHNEDELAVLLGRLEDYEGQFQLERPEIAVELLGIAETQLERRQAFSMKLDARTAVRRLMLRILQGRTPEDVERIVKTVDLPNLSSRADLLALVGHTGGAGHRLLTEDVGNRLENELADAVLIADAAKLRDEPDLAHLLWRAGHQQASRTRSRIGELIEDPLLLVRWLAGSVFEKGGASGRSILLPWPKLIEHIDEGKLAAAVRAVSSDWVVENCNETESEAVRQAKLYADDPEQGAQAFAAFTGSRWGADDGVDGRPPGK
jgi:hypothetical protein